MSVAALLTSTVSGERLDLAAAGEWTADHADALEKQVMQATPAKPGAVKSLRIDMRGVAKLDTYGAWLLERLLRGSREQGVQTDVIGLPDQFRVIVDTVHQTAELPDPERLRKKTVAGVVKELLNTVPAPQLPASPAR